MLGPRPVRCSFSIRSWHAVRVFFGAADSGQFDDLEGPALRILGDDD
ncbi:cbb3-type cytochrome oxidase assembly protein [Massilia sp. CT11-108]